MDQPRSTSIRIELPHSDGLTLHARRWGDAAPRFLFIHGFGEGHYVWNEVIASLKAHGPAVAVDLRGHGDSDHDPAREYSTKVHVADIRVAMQTLCMQPVIVIGHSLGAEVAIHLAVSGRDKIDGAILVDGGPQLCCSATDHIRQQFASQAWWYSTLDEYVQQLQQTLPLAEPGLLRALAPYILRIDRARGYRLKCDKALTEAWARTDEATLWSLFRSIDFPFLVVRGQASAVLPYTTVERMLQENAYCSLQTVAYAGHSVMRDNLRGFLAAMNGYISMLPAAAALATR